MIFVSNDEMYSRALFTCVKEMRNVFATLGNVPGLHCFPPPLPCLTAPPPPPAVDLPVKAGRDLFFLKREAAEDNFFFLVVVVCVISPSVLTLEPLMDVLLVVVVVVLAAATK